MSTLNEALAEIIEKVVLERVHTLPMYVTAVAANGYVLVVKVTGDSKPEVLVDRKEAGLAVFPINFMLSDTAGTASRVLLQSGGKPQFIH